MTITIALTILCAIGAIFLAFVGATKRVVKRELRRRPPAVIEAVSFNYEDFDARR